jgi:signal transduction histidine kinase
MNLCCLLPQDASARVAEVEAAAAKASRELAEYKAESSELRNQDLTIRRLEERVRGLEADLQEKVGSVIVECGLTSNQVASCTRKCLA